MSEPVTFFSDGLRIAGDLYPVEGADGPRPGVVLCHGFTGVKGMVMPEVGAALARHGYHALAFDYRFFGRSEGSPRGRILPLAQVEDIRAAITWLAARPEVDASRIALWGTSFGGGNAIWTAAHDTRVRAVVANIAVTRGRRWLRSLRGPEDWYRLLDRIEADRLQRALRGTSEEVSPFDIMPVDSTTVPFIREHWADVPDLPRAVTLESAQAVLEFDPQSVIHLIAPRPLLMLAVERDHIVPNEETTAAFAAAGEPKALVWLPRELGHWGAYVGEGFRRVMDESVRFLAGALDGGGAREGAGP